MAQLQRKLQLCLSNSKRVTLQFGLVYIKYFLGNALLPPLQHEKILKDWKMNLALGGVQ